ncbi:M50 family metallopeptidase [Leifsonia kafniensis]|uniref:M50 family metallopeptidase n=1 Tax=Leifsonia kafniensis TaxID=475957 RepID=A0ABP7KZ95_9MICO
MSPDDAESCGFSPHTIGELRVAAEPRSTHASCGPVQQNGSIDISLSSFDWPALFAPTAPVEITPAALLGILAIAAALSIPRVTWQWFGLFTTLVHELGHAVAALLTGRAVHGIRIRSNHSGDALSSGRGTFGIVVSGMLGYPAPALVGAAQLWSVFTGYTAIALFLGGAMLVLTVLVIRNLFGVLVVLAAAAASALLWFYATPNVQSYALLVLGTALLVGSVRGLLTVIGVHLRRRDRLPTSDAYLLYRRTGVPSPVWLALFAIVIGGCVVLAFSTYLAHFPA